jgi:nucleoside-diphosphate-sugar epimerase
MPKAFVTGGAGFVGSNVVKRLVAEGYDTTVYDSFVVYIPADPHKRQLNFISRLADVYDQISILRGDTLNKDFLRRQLNAIRPDVIIHTASMPLAALAIQHTEEAFASIVTSTLNILEVMRDFDHPCRLVFLSSSMVYGDFKTPEVDEIHEKDPRDVYGAFKLAGETVVRAYAKNYDLDTVIIRPSAVYGPYDANNRVIQKFVRSAMQGNPLTIDGDGSLKMDFTHVEDCARGIFLAATTPGVDGEVFNITRGEARSLKDLAEIIERYFPQVTVSYREKPAYVPSRGTLNIDKARRLLGFEPVVNLEDGVDGYVSHLRDNDF